MRMYVSARATAHASRCPRTPLSRARVLHTLVLTHCSMTMAMATPCPVYRLRPCESKGDATRRPASLASLASHQPRLGMPADPRACQLSHDRVSSTVSSHHPPSELEPQSSPAEPLPPGTWHSCRRLAQLQAPGTARAMAAARQVVGHSSCEQQEPLPQGALHV